MYLQILPFVKFWSRNTISQGAPTLKGRQPIIWPNFTENCMKMNKNWTRGHRKFYYVDPTLVIVCLQILLVPFRKFLSRSKARVPFQERPSMVRALAGPRGGAPPPPVQFLGQNIRLAQPFPTLWEWYGGITRSTSIQFCQNFRKTA